MAPQRPKHRHLHDELRAAIASGRLLPGERLPSEPALMRRYHVSRATTSRALRDLELAGLVSRRRGSGTFVNPAATADEGDVRIGMLVPNLDRGEIFAPICRQIAEAGHKRHVSLLWPAQPVGPDACAQLVDQGVRGVFFAPVELERDRERQNGAMVELLQKAGVALVLLDADVAPFPARGPFDVVGVDNRWVGYQLTQHLLGQGCERIAFVGLRDSATTVDGRIAGYLEALRGQAAARHAVVHRPPFVNAALVQTLLADGADGYVCANDFVAASLVRELRAAGVRVPDDARVVGVDDLGHAKDEVPLTTVHQPCPALGRTALDTMLQRLADPALPARTVTLDAPMIVRRSSS